MSKLKFEKVSTKLTKEEMVTLKGGLLCSKTNVNKDTPIKQGSLGDAYQNDVTVVNDSCDSESKE